MSNVEQQLAQLAGSGLVSLATVQPELEYLFRHALVQDAIYSSLLRTDRKWIHRRVGEALAQLYPTQQDELAAVLARHFALADEPVQALHYYERAGDQALLIYANTEAAAHYTAALAWATLAGDQARLLTGLGQAQLRASLPDVALVSWQAALAVYQAVGDSTGVIRTYAGLADAAYDSGDVPGGLAWCEQGLAFAEHDPLSPARFTLWITTARCYFFNGRRAAATEWAQRARALALQSSDPAAEAAALLTLGMIYINAPQEGLRLLTQAATLADAAGLGMIAAVTQQNAGVTLWGLGDLRAARAQFEQAATGYRRHHLISSELQSMCSACGMALWLGDFAAVQQILPALRALAALIGLGTSGLLALGLIEAELVRYQGDLAAAESRLRAVLATARGQQNIQFLLIGAYHLTGILLETGAWTAAREVLTEILPLTDLGLLLGNTWARCRLSEVAAAEGHLDAARDWLAEATARAGVLPALPNAEALALATARLAWAAGDWERAQAAYAAAVGAQATQGRIWYQAQTQRAWAIAHRARGTADDLAQALALLQQAQATFVALDVPYYAALTAAEIAQDRSTLPQ